MTSAKTMAEVLAEHSDWQYQRNLGYYRSEYICQCGGTFWYGDHEEDPSFNEALAAHQSAALSAAGYGLVADAKREALEEAADHLEEDASQSSYRDHEAVTQAQLDAGEYLRARAAEMRQG